MKKKAWDITVKDDPNRVVMGENDEFYTTDTEAYLVFKLDDKNFNPTSAVLTLENRNDGSLKNETVDVVHGLIVWEMPQRYIEHFGNWQGQLVYEDTKYGQPELYTSATFSFVVKSHIGDKKKPSLVEIENWEKFIREGTELIETWEDMEDLRQANESQRQQTELDRQAQEEARETAEAQREANELVRTDGMVKLDNLVQNGDFNEGTENWNTSGNVELDNSNYKTASQSLRVIADGSPSFASALAPAVNGHKVYINTNAYINSITSPTVGMRLYDFGSGNLSDVVLDYGKMKQWQSLSTVREISNGGVAIYLGSNGNRTFDINYDSLLVLNLTETFGAGNEPTRQEMDELIKITGYFNNEITLSQKQLLNWQLKLIRQNRNAIIALGGMS